MPNDIFAPDAAAKLLEQGAARTRSQRFRETIAEIDTADDLETFLAQLFEAKGIEDAGVSVSGDRDTLDIEVDGVGINDDGVITNPLRTFDVQVTLTLTQTFEVEGYSEDEAAESFEFGGDNYHQIEEAFGWQWEQERCEVEATARW